MSWTTGQPCSPAVPPSRQVLSQRSEHGAIPAAQTLAAQEDTPTDTAVRSTHLPCRSTMAAKTAPKTSAAVTPSRAGKDAPTARMIFTVATPVLLGLESALESASEKCLPL